MLLSKTAPDSLTILRALVVALFVCATASLVLAAILGFEEPNNSLLLVSAGLIFTAVVAAFAHLAFTQAMDRAQKRIWLRQLTGRRAVYAWVDYLTCDDLPAAATRFAKATSPGSNESTAT